jgi:hypothetical protein
VILLSAPALSQSSTDTLAIEEAAVRVTISNTSTTNGRPRYILDSAIVKREAAPGYPVGARSTARSRRLAEALGVPYMGRDEAIVCDSLGCVIRNANALVHLSEVLFVGDTASVTVTIDRQGPDRWLRGARRRRMDYETLHYVFKREVAGWKVIKVTQLGIS